TNNRGDMWCYQRTGGDHRLTDRFSCGVGGHVDKGDEDVDVASTVIKALRRELAEVLAFDIPHEHTLHPSGWIFEQHTAIGRVHLGLVFHIPWTNPENPNPVEGESLNALGFMPRELILSDKRFELWSHLALHLIEDQP
ncbi:MAG: hypothetical protein ACR2HF_05535, partial [Methylococcaceae bacterium]